MPEAGDDQGSVDVMRMYNTNQLGSSKPMSWPPDLMKDLKDQCTVWKWLQWAFCLWHLTCFHLLLLAIWVVTLILLILFYFLLLKAFLMSITYHTRGPTTRIKSSRIDWQQSWWRRGRLCKQSFTVYRYKFWLEYLCVSWLQPAFMRIAVLYHTTSIRSHKLKYADGKLHAADLCRCKKRAVGRPG